MRSVGTTLLALGFLLVASQARGDKFSLNRAMAHDPHFALSLTQKQIDTVGRERKLVLNATQKAALSKYVNPVPTVLGVESPREPDCSCHISSAMWTAISEVTIWTDRLARDPDGSKFYYEIRRQPGHYTANARGELFFAGRPVSWAGFEAVVKAPKDGVYLQLSCPPVEPLIFQQRVRRLQAKRYFNTGL